MGNKSNESNEWLEEEKGPEKPAGLTAITVLLVISGVQYVISGSSWLLDFTAAYYTIVSAMMLVLGVAFIIVGRGLANWRRWALLGAIVISSLTLFLTIGVVITGIYAFDYSIILGIVINLTIILYLIRPEIRAQFEQYGYSSSQ